MVVQDLWCEYSVFYKKESKMGSIHPKNRFLKSFSGAQLLFDFW
jgi:hypothetical protein